MLLEELPRIRERFARDRHMSHEAKALAGEAIDGMREIAGRAAAAATELTVAIVWPMTLSDGFLTLLRVHHRLPSYWLHTTAQSSAPQGQSFGS